MDAWKPARGPQCRLQPYSSGRWESDALEREAFQVVDELEDLLSVFAVAPSLADPAGRAMADPVHSDVCEGKEAENPIVENDVGVVDADEGRCGELGIFVRGAVEHAATGAYARWPGFSTVGVVQDMVAPVHSVEAGGISIQDAGDLAEWDGLCLEPSGCDRPECGVFRLLLGKISEAVGEVNGCVGRGGFVEVLEKGTEVGASAAWELGNTFAFDINRPWAVQLGVAGVELDIHLGVGAEDSAKFIQKAAERLIVDRSAGIDTERNAHGFAIHSVKVEFVSDEAAVVGGEIPWGSREVAPEEGAPVERWICHFGEKSLKVFGQVAVRGRADTGDCGSLRECGIPLVADRRDFFG